MKPEDAIQQLRHVDPAPREIVEGAATRRSAQVALDEILADTPARGPLRRVPQRAPLGIAATIVVALIAITVAIVRVPAGVELPTTQVVLSRAARVAAGGHLPSLAAGQYAYQRTEMVERLTATSGDGQWTALLPIRREVWAAPDGSGRIREVSGQPRFPGPRDRMLWERAGQPPVGRRASDRHVPPGTLLPEGGGAGLPTDATGLGQMLRRQGATSMLPPDVALFVAASDLLSQPLVPPAVRGALYQVVASVENVRVIGEIDDPSGRPGIGVAISSGTSGDPREDVLIFDQATSQVLAEQVTYLREVEWMDADPPFTTDWKVFEESAIVSSDRDRPA